MRSQLFEKLQSLRRNQFPNDPPYSLSMPDIRPPLKRQYHAALAMLRQAVADCPDDLWTWGEHPRTYWRIAYHAAGYAHLYLYGSLDDWARWEKADNSRAVLEGDVEPAEPYTRDEMLDFIDLIDSQVDARIEALDFESESCRFAWYPGVTRFELIVLSLRHLHGHIGQLHEHLIARGLDVEWHGQLAREPAPT